MLGILGAMSVETDGLIEKLTDKEEIFCGALKYAKGKLNGKEIVVCKCGVGKVASSTAAALMIEKFKPDSLINIGVAGGVKPLRQGDIVIANKTVQHDYDGTADGLKLGQIHGFDSVYFDCDENLVKNIEKIAKARGFSYKIGTVATGDCFVSSKDKSNAIAKTFDAIAFDMESGAINQLCTVQNIPFVALRAISDNGDDEAVKSFYEFVTEAAQKSITLVSDLISSL